MTCSNSESETFFSSVRSSVSERISPLLYASCRITFEVGLPTLRQ